MSRQQKNLKESIFEGSKSFALASLIFNHETKLNTWRLYAWCRMSDDEIDKDPTQAKKKLDEMKKKLKQLYLGENTCKEQHWQFLQQVVDDTFIPEMYLQNMLQGFEIDAEAKLIQDERDLDFYCHAVAGVVGTMMCHIMGVSDVRALSHADALGRAMQLTNITRDLFEDYSNNRVYLPEKWLLDFQIKREDIFEDKNNLKLQKLVDKLFLRAEAGYQNGLQGARYLKPRAALAVIIAAYTYRQIGRKIKRLKNPTFKNRVFITSSEKTLLVIYGFFYWLSLIPAFLANKQIYSKQLPVLQYKYAS